MVKEGRRRESYLSVMLRKLEVKFSAWLLYEEKLESLPLQDFSRMSQQLLPADVLLFEGRSRISRAISVISQSQWTHAAIYIGRASELRKDSELAVFVNAHYAGDPNEQLVIESFLGKGTIITPLSDYASDNIRLCRPRGILEEDVRQVVHYALMQLGREYDIRQMIDLARFVFPYAILPRRWLSSLFNYKAGEATRTVCSTMIAEAFMHVQFPVVPILRAVDKNISVARRNPRLFTPRDFDYSPYFDVLKFPKVNYDQYFLGMRRKGGYRELPWDLNDTHYYNSSLEWQLSEHESINKSLEKGEQS